MSEIRSESMGMRTKAKREIGFSPLRELMSKLISKGVKREFIELIEEEEFESLRGIRGEQLLVFPWLSDREFPMSAIMTEETWPLIEIMRGMTEKELLEDGVLLGLSVDEIAKRFAKCWREGTCVYSRKRCPSVPGR